MSAFTDASVGGFLYRISGYHYVALFIDLRLASKQIVGETSIEKIPTCVYSGWLICEIGLTKDDLFDTPLHP